VTPTILDHIMTRYAHDSKLGDHGWKRRSAPRLGKVPAEDRAASFSRFRDIVVQISDDEAVLDHERISQAREGERIVPEGARLSEAEIHNLIFQPGFRRRTKCLNYPAAAWV